MITAAIKKITYRSQIFPKEAFRVIRASKNEEAAKPYLREALEKAIQEQTDLDGDYQLQHFYALFLFGAVSGQGGISKDHRTCIPPAGCGRLSDRRYDYIRAVGYPV